MPYYKSPQRLDGSGPGVQFTPDRPYWINSYLLPPIDAGQQIGLTLLSDKPGETVVLLTYYDESLQTIVGPALVDVIFAPSQKGLVTFSIVERPGRYMLVITSFNSSYTFYLTSVWSPFYQFRTLAIYSFGLIPIGFVMAYYDSLLEEREAIAEKALAGIRRAKS